jgi:glutamate-5-semialdehyde dehydrogenase
MSEQVLFQLQSAKLAWRALMAKSTVEKNKALQLMADLLLKNQDKILAANAQDVVIAKVEGLSGPMLARLELNEKKIISMVDGIKNIEGLEDPIGRMVSMVTRPNGLQVGKITVPIGVIAVIFESRPNVTSDVVALAVKSGNSIVLRGGKESIRTNQVIVDLLRQALKNAELPMEAIQFINSPDRKVVGFLLNATEFIDVVIPRGGESLIRAVVEQSHIPVIFQYKGVCHTFVDASADIDMAVQIALNAKVSNPSVCNAMECLLVHRDIANFFLPKVASKLFQEKVEIRGDQETVHLIPGSKLAEALDYGREFLDLILAVKIVGSLDEALEHIQKYGSMHSEAIVTNDYENSQKFLKTVDAACVYVNASTRFTDGGEFGLGAEVGISTQKLHARGPMGLAELTSTKYIILGSGQIR